MDKPITGRCFCGAVRIRIDAPPVAARACWCRDCQYLSSGNASVNIAVPRSSLTISGTTSAYVSKADSGSEMRRSFCPTCGTPLFSESSSRPTLIVVRAGALDDPEVGRPTGMIWTSSAPPWGFIDPTLPCFAQQAPAAPDPR